MQAATASGELAKVKGELAKVKELAKVREELVKVKEELADERCRRIDIEGDYENLYARWLA